MVHMMEIRNLQAIDGAETSLVEGNAQSWWLAIFRHRKRIVGALGETCGCDVWLRPLVIVYLKLARW